MLKLVKKSNDPYTEYSKKAALLKQATLYTKGLPSIDLVLIENIWFILSKDENSVSVISSSKPEFDLRNWFL